MSDFDPQSLHPPSRPTTIPRNWMTDEYGFPAAGSSTSGTEVVGQQIHQNDPETSRLPHNLPNPDSFYDFIFNLRLSDNGTPRHFYLFNYDIKYLYDATDGFQKPQTEDIIRDELRVGPNTTMEDGTSISDFLLENYNVMLSEATTIDGWVYENNQNPERTPMPVAGLRGGKRKTRRRKPKKKRRKSRRRRRR